MKDKLKPIAELFQAAFRSISVLRDEPTARSEFNRAQRMLDELEKIPHAELGKLRQLRTAVRGMVNYSSTRLHERMKIYAHFWAEAVAKL